MAIGDAEANNRFIRCERPYTLPDRQSLPCGLSCWSDSCGRITGIIGPGGTPGSSGSAATGHPAVLNILFGVFWRFLLCTL